MWKIWKKLVSWFSGLGNIFRSKRKQEHHDKPEERHETHKKKPITQTPTITKETQMELTGDPEEHKYEGLLERVEKSGDKPKAPEPPSEPLTNEEAKNMAKMLPILLALSMATTGKEPEKAPENKPLKKTKRKKLKFTKREIQRRGSRVGKKKLHRG